ncbi:MAG: AAA family ATPase [Anaerolineae bacterium]|nr:AAA family ATPase [Anaerolineae bacterium]
MMKRENSHGFRLSDAAETPALHALSLVGRNAELAIISERLDALSKQKGSKLALEGESGVGKSRLAWEAVNLAYQHGLDSLLIDCRGSLNRPFDPITDLVRALLEVEPGQSSEAQRKQALQAINKLGLADRSDEFMKLFGLPSTGALEAATQQMQAAEPTSTIILSGDAALPGLIARLLKNWSSSQRSGERPLLLIFEDLDEASEPARSVCLSLAQRTNELPLCILATYTLGAASDIHTVFEGSVVKLNRLQPADALSLGASMASVPRIPEDLVQPFMEYTGGLPLSIWLAARRLAGGQTIEPVSSILAAQVDSLTEGQRETLLAAAILGDGMRIGALRTVRGNVHEEELFEDLSALVKESWLDASGVGRLRVYRFTNRLVREMITKSIPHDLKEKLHQRAGDYFAVPATGRRLRAEAAIHHYMKASAPDRALSVIDMALAEARRSLDRDRTLKLYRRGAEIARGVPELSTRQAELAEKLGDMYVAAGDYAAAAQVYRELSPPDSPFIIHSKLALSLIAVEPFMAVRTLPDVINTLPISENDDLRWRLEAGYVWALALSDQDYEALRRCRDVLSQMTNTSGLGGARALMRGMLGMVLHYQGEHEDAYTHLESARAGWGARGDQDAVLLINQVLIDMPADEITRSWLRLVMKPLLVHN